MGFLCMCMTKRCPASTKKAERSRRVESRPQAKSVSGPTKKHTDDLFAKEQQYKLLNAQLEAKTAEIVRQAEQLMKEQTEVLSKPLSNILLTDTEVEEDSRLMKPQQCTEQQPGVKMVTKKKATSTKQEEPQQKSATSKVSHVEDSAAVEHSADYFLAKTIQNMEEKMTDVVVHENAVDDVTNTGANVGSVVSDAQMRVLKAKLRIMQEELDELSSEYYKRDDENSKLSAKIRELEEDRARLQKTTNIQQTQIEKHRALAEESAKKCDGLQLQVSGLHKEIENLNRSHKQAAAVHSTVEVRLNRALEEVERLKTQLNKMEQTNKDKINEEHQSKENLLAENKMLKKQKAELIVGFKKQLKLIDILKRQKMHFEAAKLLSFTEEEFMKALDWGKA
uniref:Testis expressed 9 n=1 Tax=Amphiprion percula TaxID=161767 RepID=A0A3P8T078_AMPPE